MRTLLVDGNNIVIRSMKAVEGRAEMSADGVSTGHLVVCINTLSRYIREVQPDRVVVCFDSGRSQRRVAIYPDYKANRKTSEDEIAITEGDHRTTEAQRTKADAFGLVTRFLSLAGVHHIHRPGIEADDLIAYYCLNRTPGDEAVILSGDKDFFQLLDDGVTQHRPGKEQDIWNGARVAEHLGCTPTQLPDVMALTGDSIDGVPGVPGFGAKTAVKFLSRYDWDFEALLTAAVEGKEMKLQPFVEIARISRSLVDLRDSDFVDVPLPVLPEFAPTDHTSPLWTELLSYLDQYKLRSIKDRISRGELWRDRPSPS